MAPIEPDDKNRTFDGCLTVYIKLYHRMTIKVPLPIRILFYFCEYLFFCCLKELWISSLLVVIFC